MEPFYLADEFIHPLRNYKDSNLASRSRLKSKGRNSSKVAIKIPGYQTNETHLAMLYK